MAKKKDYYERHMYSAEVLAYSNVDKERFKRTSSPKAPAYKYQQHGLSYYSDFATFAERKRLNPESKTALKYWREYLTRDDMIVKGNYLHARNTVFKNNLFKSIGKIFGGNTSDKDYEKLRSELRFNFDKLSDEQLYKMTTLAPTPNTTITANDVFTLTELYGVIDTGTYATLRSKLVDLFKRIGIDYTSLEDEEPTISPTLPSPESIEKARYVYADVRNILHSAPSLNEIRQAQSARSFDPTLRRNTVAFSSQEVLSVMSLRNKGYTTSQARAIVAQIRAERKGSSTFYVDESGKLHTRFIAKKDIPIVLDFFTKIHSKKV